MTQYARNRRNLIPIEKVHQIVLLSEDHTRAYIARELQLSVKTVYNKQKELRLI